MEGFPINVRHKIANYYPEQVMYPRRKIGCDPMEWVSSVVLPRIERDEVTGKYRFPNPLSDFCDFSTLHSWYKHFRDPGKVFPVLTIGRMKKHRFNDSDRNKLHWTFILDNVLFDKVRGSYFVENLPWKIMQGCSFYLSHTFYGFSLDDDGRYLDDNIFFAKCMYNEVLRIQDRITRILLLIDPTPPKKMVLSYDNEIDPLCLWGEDDIELCQIENPNYVYRNGYISVQINGIFYKINWGIPDINIKKEWKKLQNEDYDSDESS